MNFSIINSISTAPDMGTGVGGFLVSAINWLSGDGKYIALGIILFTLILKLITLPFDFMSRASMRKNSLKMEEMRPELERLQKQYANDKNLYNQKMTALYKKNGYSMWGACLPTILTIVIFIIAINGFTSYSLYQRRLDYYEMEKAYNSVVYEGLEKDGKYITLAEDGKLLVDDAYLYENGTTEVKDEEGNLKFVINVEKTADKLTVYTSNGYIKYVKAVTAGENGSVNFSDASYEIIEDKLDASGLTYRGLTFSQNNDELDAAKFLNEIGAERSAVAFRENKTSFLWVKNIWVTDSPLKHPISDAELTELVYTDGCACSCNRATSEFLSKEDFETLTSHLEDEKSQPNGFFIWIVLTAASSFLMQFISGKSQKAQMELQTVDGQGMQSQKMMNWMMPLMMAFFAFMYTTAFSIYIVLSSGISVLTTLGINFIVDKRYAKSKQKTGAVRGRVYVPKEEPKQEEKAKKSKKKKDEPKVDFLNSEKVNREITKENRRNNK